MKPVDMIELHDPDNGQWGDCFRACIASLMEVPPEEVPHFCHGCVGTDDEGVAFIRLQEYLEPQGLTFVEFCVGRDREFLDEWIKSTERMNAYHIISANTIRGTFHATVGYNGKVVHDPHPSRDGLLEVAEDNPWYYGFIVRRC